MTTEPKKTTKKKSQTYNTIEQLDAIEHIRLRPGMYIGTNDTPAHLFSEVIDNALDEAANGYCNRIDITYKDHIVTIQDNGRGIPHSKTNKGQEAIIAATENMSGGKFNRDNYAKAVGLHGVGLCAVRALSDFLTISSVRDGEEYCAKFNDANLVSFEKKKVSDNQGTFVQFRPCTKYFESDDIPISYVIERVRVALTEIRKLKIFFNDEELHPYSDEELLANSDIKFPLMSGSDKNNNEMFLRLGYTTVGLQSDEAGSVNLLPVNAGTHVDIAKKALIEAWNLTGYIDDLELKPEDVLVGSHLYASASFVETAWTSQDKKQLKMRIKEFDDLIKSLAKNIMRSIQQLSKESKDALLRKFIDYRESQNRLSTAKYMQGVVKYGDEGKTTKRSFSSDSKLVDCVSEDRESTELFVCLHRDTEVKLLDGTVHTIKDLAENYSDKEFEVYSWDMNEKKVIKAIAYNPRITGQTNKYVHIEVGDRKVDCTFDHKFVDYRTQKFVEARNLKIGDTLCTEDGESEVTLIESVYISEYEDVYCLTVKNEFHTFMLANGLITKNCEGNSAGSNLISQRDPMIHAVLPLRGKPRNIMEESVETILNNLEMRSIVNSLGTGLMKHERPELCRYGKIIITADADCFTGDTKVYTCDGKNWSMEEAYKKEIDLWVLSKDDNGNTVPVKATVCKSRKVSIICELELDNGKVIRCTPDQKIMLKNGDFKSAEDLKKEDSLSPLYTKRCNCTNLIKTDDIGKYIKLQNLVSSYYPYIYPNSKLDKIVDIHHMNHNHDNNNPDNLVILDHKKHGSLHLTEYNKSEKHKETNKLVAKRPDKHIKNVLNITSYNKSEKHKESVQKLMQRPEIKERNRNMMISYNKSEKHKSSVIRNNKDESMKLLQMKGRVLKFINRMLRLSRELDIELTPETFDTVYRHYKGKRLTFNKCMEFFTNFDDLVNKARDYNHFIVSSKIISLNEPVQMYDLIVPKYHNFALESGIFVHNCDGLQISSLVLAALCYLVPKTVLSGRVYLLTAPLYGIFGQNITEFEVEGKEPRYYLSSDKLIVNNVEMLSKDIKKNSQCKDKAGNEFLVKSVKKYDKKEFIPLWECYTSPSIQLKRYKGLGSMSPEESKIALLSDKRRLQMITGTSIDKVMKLVGETEFKKILMKQNDILDWQC